MKRYHPKLYRKKKDAATRKMLRTKRKRGLIKRRGKKKVWMSSGMKEHMRSIKKYSPSLYEKQLRKVMKEIEFDGQAFWYGSRRLGEVSEELQWNWDKLTPRVINKHKRLMAEYVIDTGITKETGW